MQEREPSTLREMGTLADKRVGTWKAKNGLRPLPVLIKNIRKTNGHQNIHNQLVTINRKAKSNVLIAMMRGTPDPSAPNQKHKTMRRKNKQAKVLMGQPPGLLSCVIVSLKKTHIYLEAVVDIFRSQETANTNSEPWYIDRNGQINECLAIIWAIKQWHVYLYGNSFHVQTDHKSLQWSERMKHTNNRLTRWSLALQPYHMTTSYRKGSANANADAFSWI